MIPEFNRHGLLPPGIWECSKEQIAARFCWNPLRSTLFKNLNTFLSTEWRQANIECPILINGSFVRNIPSPSDIDTILDMSHTESDETLALAIAVRLRHDAIKSDLRVDVWVNYPRCSDDFIKIFQQIGTKAAAELRMSSTYPKGILRILP